ncbi:unnamed protein product [Calypogeia fissa]
MRFLGFDEWFTIYLLAQKNGVQVALHRLCEYASILDCLEGDDLFDLQRQLSIVRSFEAVLTRAALDTEKAKNAFVDRPRVVLTSTSPVLPSPIIPPSIPLGSISVDTPNLLFTLLFLS